MYFHVVSNNFLKTKSFCVYFYLVYSTLLTDKDSEDDFFNSMTLKKKYTIVSDYQNSGSW